ncbi:MAG: ferric reductase-like transmembrane domain-containing protein [Pseudomonadota bacterium]
MIRKTVLWASLLAALAIPLMVAGFSPLLTWRDPVYIAAGFSGIIGLGLLLVQPLLAARVLSGLTPMTSRNLHRLLGVALIISILLHVGGLWITSPPDVIDALLFVSPTPFSDWGVVAMWAAFGAAVLALYRTRLRLRFRIWRLCHAGLATITILGSVIHAMLIEGTMEVISKTALCVLVVLATAQALAKLRVWDVKRRT